MAIFIRGVCSAALGGLLVLSAAPPLAVAQQQQPPDKPANPTTSPPFRLTPGGQPAPASDLNTPVIDPAAMNPAFRNPYLIPIPQSMPGANLGTFRSPYRNSSSRYGNLTNPNSIPYYNPYSYPNYNPYTSYYYDPYGGVLRGIADVTNANAQYVAILQQSRIIQQRANQAAIDTRRRMFDQIRQERSFMPAPEDVRVQEMQMALHRSRRNPPLVEIWSGESTSGLCPSGR